MGVSLAISSLRLAIGGESSAGKVLVEAEILTEPQLFHDGEARAIHPADPPVAIAHEQIPRAAAGGAGPGRSAEHPRPGWRRIPRGARSSTPSRPPNCSVEVVVDVRREL